MNYRYSVCVYRYIYSAHAQCVTVSVIACSTTHTVYYRCVQIVCSMSCSHTPDNVHYLSKTLGRRCINVIQMFCVYLVDSPWPINPHKTRDVNTMLVLCRANVVDGVPTINKHFVNVLYLQWLRINPVTWHTSCGYMIMSLKRAVRLQKAKRR